VCFCCCRIAHPEMLLPHLPLLSCFLSSPPPLSFFLRKPPLSLGRPATPPRQPLCHSRRRASPRFEVSSASAWQNRPPRPLSSSVVIQDPPPPPPPAARCALVAPCKHLTESSPRSTLVVPQSSSSSRMTLPPLPHLVELVPPPPLAEILIACRRVPPDPPVPQCRS
jgi:hypothetical protein